MSNKVVFYGAGEYAAMSFKRVKTLIAPNEVVAFVDSDHYKQGHVFFGLPVLSFAEVIKKFGDVCVYVTANERTAPDIIGYLLENGVSPERILNYEPVEKRLGCAWAETYLGLQPEGEKIIMQCCARNEINQKLIRTPYMNNNSNFDIALLLQFMDYVYEIANSLKKRMVHDNCKCCSYIKDAYYYQRRKIRQLAITGINECNFNCIYCSNNYFEYYKYAVFEDSYNAFTKVADNTLIDSDTFIALGSGEFSIKEAGNKLVKMISKYKSSLFTNASTWSESASQALESGNSYLYVSVDAGTRETFRKVKGVEAFDKVCANLRRYSGRGPIVLKYIICEGLNENDADIEGFFRLADEVASLVVLSRDYYQKGSLSDDTLAQCARFISHFRKTGKMGSLIGFGARKDERVRLDKILNKVEQ